MNLVHRPVTEIGYKQSSLIRQVDLIERSLQLADFRKWRANVYDNESWNFRSMLFHYLPEVCQKGIILLSSTLLPSTL